MKQQNSYSGFLEKRKAVSEGLGKQELWEVIDQWPLYAGVFNLARNMAIAEIIKASVKVPGHIAEFGSWKGANLMLMAKLLRIYDPMCNKKVFGFEGFEGLGYFDDKDFNATTEAGTYKGNYEHLLTFIDLFDMQDTIILKKGNILETLPAFLEADPSAGFSVVYIDTDLYATTKLILEKMHGRLSTGGCFVLDEWNYEQWPGESIAVREFVEANPGVYAMENISNTRQPSLLLRKLK
jgi:hypothetical protein